MIRTTRSYASAAVAVLIAVGVTTVLTAGHPSAHAQTREVTIYSYREPALTQGLLATFTWTTGIKVNLVHGKDMIEQAAAEKSAPKGDVLLTNDGGLLVQAKAAGITAPISSPIVTNAIAGGLRDRDGHWFALSRNARVLIVSAERVPETALTYEALAEPRFKGRICMRSGVHPYNIGLTAAMLKHHGEAKTEAWLRGLKANLARKPTGGDRDQIKAVAEGVCDVAIANSYYLGVMAAGAEGAALIAKVRLVFPNREDRGTYTNVTGMARIAGGPNEANAIRLMDFLASAMAQTIYVERNNEYAVNTMVAPSTRLRTWGTLKSEPFDIEGLAGLRGKAKALIEKVDVDGSRAS